MRCTMENRAELRGQLVRAAASLIESQESSYFEHLAVAEAAGMDLGTLTKVYPSLADLREDALGHLADLADAELDQLEPYLSRIDTEPAKAARAIYDSFADKHRVRADLSLTVAGAYDPSLSELASRWTDRMTTILARRIGRDRATAIVVFIDGLTVRAALDTFPTNLQLVTDVITALVNLELTKR